MNPCNNNLNFLLSSVWQLHVSKSDKFPITVLRNCFSFGWFTFDEYRIPKVKPIENRYLVLEKYSIKLNENTLVSQY
jgi:hypothetical protein